MKSKTKFTVSIEKKNQTSIDFLSDFSYEIDLFINSATFSSTFSYEHCIFLHYASLLLVFLSIVSTMSENFPKLVCTCQSSEPHRDKLIIYQILVRLFGNRNLTNIVHGTIEQNGVGKMNDINDKCLNEIKKFGYTHVWYCGVLEHATMTDYTAYGIRKDNPYIVK